MTVVKDLLTAIDADPEDEAPQLVIADLLIAEGDPRGELIVLDHRERTGQLDERDGLERLLLLAAEYSFPCAVEPAPLVFERVPFERSTYETQHGDDRYTVTYRNDLLAIVRESRVPVPPPHDHDPVGDGAWPTYGYPDRYDHYLDTRDYDRFTAEEERVILTILGDAIRAEAPLDADELRFPYGTMPLPQYDGGPVRCYQLPTEFTIPRGILRNRYGLAARDHARWHRIWDRLRRLS